jgi:hypothetical protein
VVTREQFERRLYVHLELIRTGTSAKAKRVTGDAWRFIVDKMYQERAARLTEENLSTVADDCARAIAAMLDSIKP